MAVTVVFLLSTFLPFDEVMFAARACTHQKKTRVVLPKLQDDQFLVLIGH